MEFLTRIRALLIPKAMADDEAEQTPPSETTAELERRFFDAPRHDGYAPIRPRRDDEDTQVT